MSYGAECYCHSSWIFVTNVEKFIQECSNMRKISIFFFFFSYQKLGVRLIHVCAVYTRLYGNENIRKCTFLVLSCYCRAEKYGFPQQNTDFGVWEYWKAQIQLGSSDTSLWTSQTSADHEQGAWYQLQLRAHWWRDARTSLSHCQVIRNMALPIFCLHEIILIFQKSHSTKRSP